MTASLGNRLAGMNSDRRPKTKRSNEFRFGARRRPRLLMTNWCFSNKDSATTARTTPGRRSLAMVASKWTASMGESSTWTVARCRHLTRLSAPLHLCEDLRIRHGQAMRAAAKANDGPTTAEVGQHEED